ncbi:MAG: rod shape-determining protein MreC, partial [Planctomycetota bacterium]
MPGAITIPRLRAHDRGIARREIVSFAAFGVSVLALAVPTVWVSWARMEAVSVAAPLARGVAPREPKGPGDSGGAAGDLAREVRRLRARVVQLEDERRRLEDELAKGRGFEAARRRSGSPEGAACPNGRGGRARLEAGRFVEALVIGHAVNWQERSFIVDRGSADGVVPRAGVLAGGVVAGVVVEVGPRASRVAMPTEPGVRVAVRTTATRRSGLAVGTGDSCELRYVERWAAGFAGYDGPGTRAPAGGLTRLPDPGTNESVVTSGRLGFFPPGFLVGRVASVGAPRESPHLSIALEPELVHPPEGRVWILNPGPRDVR